MPICSLKVTIYSRVCYLSQITWAKPEKNPVPCLFPLLHVGEKIIKCHCWSAITKSNGGEYSRGGKFGPMGGNGKRRRQREGEREAPENNKGLEDAELTELPVLNTTFQTQLLTLFTTLGKSLGFSVSQCSSRKLANIGQEKVSYRT